MNMFFICVIKIKGEDNLSDIGRSKIVIKNEAKSPDDVQIVLHFKAIEPDYLLCVLQHNLDLSRTLHHVIELRTECQLCFIIKLKEIRGVAEVTCCYLLHWFFHPLLLYFIMFTKSRRDVVFAPIIERELKRG